MDHPPYIMHYTHPPVDDLAFKIEYNHTPCPRLVNIIILSDDALWAELLHIIIVYITRSVPVEEEIINVYAVFEI